MLKQWRRNLLAALSVLAVLGVSCDMPEPAIAVIRTPENDLRILYQPCREEALIYTLVVKEPLGPILWRIHSQDGSTRRDFTVGVVPREFVEEVPLTSSLEAKYLRVTFTTTEVPSDDEAFDMDDVTHDRVLVPRRGYMSIGEFRARNTCAR